MSKQDRRDNAYPMLSVEQAQERVLSFAERLDTERVPILEALDRILAQSVVAPADVPPHNNSAMDGYAVRGQDLTGQSELTLDVVGHVPAGRVWQGVVGEGQALRIMTGAAMPRGTDTVIRFEDTESTGDSVRILRVPAKGRNVRLAGEDIQAGQLVLSQGQKVRPQEIGMLASMGQSTALVYRRPIVAILATGDEILEIDAPDEPGKIRNINSYSVAAQARQAGAIAHVLPIARDREIELSQRLQSALDLGADLIVTSGGVSVGDFDLVKQVLRAEGNIDFWWVNMKPGKPMAFGTLKGTPLLALPGNPVASMISFWLFGVLMVRKMMGDSTYAIPRTSARLDEPVKRKDGRRHYLRVTLSNESEGLVARFTGDQGSGILMSMVQAHGLAVIPEDRQQMDRGEWVDVLLFDPYQPERA